MHHDGLREPLSQLNLPLTLVSVSCFGHSEARLRNSPPLRELDSFHIQGPHLQC